MMSEPSTDAFCAGDACMHEAPPAAADRLAVPLRRGKIPSPAHPASAATATLTAAPAALAVFSDPASAAMPGPAEIAAGAPIWVWPLLAALVWLGWSRTRPRTVGRMRVLILPAVLSALGIASFVANGALVPSATALLVALAAGAMAGEALAKRDGSYLDENGMVHLKGEWISMALILTIFSARFAAGAVQGIDPALAHTAAVAAPLAAVSGFSIGLTGMRALTQAGLWR